MAKIYKMVYKYDVPHAANFVVSLPTGAEILDIQVQDDNIRMWALIDVDVDTYENRTFKLAGTGTPMKFDKGTKSRLGKGYKHIGTVQQDGYVWHIFEVWEA